MLGTNQHIINIIQFIKKFRSLLFSSCCLLIIFLLLLGNLTNTNIAKADGIRLAVDLTEEIIAPSETIEITAALVDEEGNKIAEDSDLLIRVEEQGEILELGQEGHLSLEEGKAEFTYQAAEREGSDRIVLFVSTAGVGYDVGLQVVADSEELIREEVAKLTGVIGQVLKSSLPPEDLVLEDDEETVTDLLLAEPDDDIWESALPYDEFYSGDRIRTMADSRARLEFFNASEALIEPDSLVRVEEMGVIDGDGGINRASFELLDGSIVAKAQDFLNQGSSFQIETETVTAGVRGTLFSLSYDEEAGSTEAKVYEGRIVLRDKSTDEIYNVFEGESFYQEAPGAEPDIEQHEQYYQEIEEASNIAEEKEKLEKTDMPVEKLEAEEEEKETTEKEDDEEDLEEDEGGLDLIPDWQDD